jgi:hypothetical protein
MMHSPGQQEHQVRITQVFRVERQIVVAVAAPDAAAAVELQSGDDAPSFDAPGWESAWTLENEQVDIAIVEPGREEGAVRKVEILLTLLMDKADEDRLSVMGLGQIAHEMDFGSMVGAYGVTSSRPVPVAALEAELLALGNDGSFFDYLLEERP